MALQFYGIFAPVLGLRQDFPTLLLQEAMLADCSNIRLRHGEIWSAKGRTAMLAPIPDGKDVLAYHWFIRKSGGRTLFAFTEDNIWKWLTAAAVGADTFTGSGLDDLTTSGTYVNTVAKSYRVEIDATGTPDTFRWSDDGGATWTLSAVSMTGAAQQLEYGVMVTFGATTGHTIGDRWDFTATAGNWIAHLATGEGKPGTDGIGPCTEWSVVDFNEKVFATNNVDKVFIGDDATTFDWTHGDTSWTASGVRYATDAYVTRARFLAVFENYLILGAVEESASVLPQRLRFSAIGDFETFDGGDAGFIDIPGSDFLTGREQKQDHLLLFKSQSVHRMWLQGSGELVFNTSRMTAEVGCLAPGSVVRSKAGKVYFVATDFTFREVEEGEVSQPVDPTLREIPHEQVGLIRAGLVPEYGELWLSIPFGGGAEANTRTMIYDAERNVWVQRDVGIGAFGAFENVFDYTWDTLPFESWDEWDWESWDSVRGSSGFLQRIAAGVTGEGKTFNLGDAELDDGQVVESSFVLSTELSQKSLIGRYKRITKMHFYVRPGGDSAIEFSIRMDHAPGWRTVGTVPLAGGSDILIHTIPCDFRGRHFLLRGRSEGVFRFVGVMFEYAFVGDR